MVDLNELCKIFVGQKFIEGQWDCYKLVIAWFKQLDFNIPDYKYERFWFKKGENYFLQEYHKLWQSLGRDIKPIMHDVAMFKFISPVPNHVGVCLGDGRFIHVLEKEGTVIARLCRYEKLLYGFYRLRELYVGKN